MTRRITELLIKKKGGTGGKEILGEGEKGRKVLLEEEKYGARRKLEAVKKENL